MVSGVNNVSSLNSLRFLDRNQKALDQSLQRLSSGRKINRGADDPAALIASERLAAEIAALESETRANERQNATASITDGHLSQAGTLINDLNRLVVASANTAGLTDAEISANQQQIDSIVQTLHRSFGDALSSLNGLPIPNDGANQIREELQSASASLSTILSGGSASLTSHDLETTQAAVSGALTAVVNSRGIIGSYQKNTLETRRAAIETSQIALIKSKSQLVDTDYAEESATVERAQLAVKASIKVLKITNQTAGKILDLFG